MKSSRKQLVWRRDKYRCKYCQELCTERNVTVDHIFPKWKGGTNDMNNLVTSCRSCNLAKGKKEEKNTRKY